MENQNPKFIFLMILLFNRHAGLVINCGKAIDEKLKKGLDEINISIKSNRLQKVRKMVERFVEEDIYRLL
jgi:hypothetical protein